MQNIVTGDRRKVICNVLLYVSGNNVVYNKARLKVCGELIKYYIDNGIGHISIFLLIVFKGVNSS